MNSKTTRWSRFKHWLFTSQLLQFRVSQGNNGSHPKLVECDQSHEYPVRLGMMGFQEYLLRVCKRAKIRKVELLDDIEMKKRC